MFQKLAKGKEPIKENENTIWRELYTSYKNCHFIYLIYLKKHLKERQFRKGNSSHSKKISNHLNFLSFYFVDKSNCLC